VRAFSHCLWHRLPFALALAALAGSAGCGDEGGLGKLVPVSGRVLVANQPLPSQIRDFAKVWFYPQGRLLFHTGQDDSP
jgi:hypothetical protein